MTEVERLVRELEHAHAGTPWHGPSRAAVLADVSIQEAVRQPSANGHSIWQLVLHMSTWTSEVAHWLRGGARRLPLDGTGDWPTPPSPGETAWRETLTVLDRAHHDLVTALRESPPSVLDEHVGALVEHKVSYRVTLHGLAQHDAYHTGQISLLKRLYRDEGLS
jgi:uncharacterized damage-inducible protein DinB